MNKNQIKIVDCFTELIVYTLEFKENSQNDIYTIEKLSGDYKTLIIKAKDRFKLRGMEFMDAFFPVAVWIDEVILNSQNKDKRLWRKELLQKKFFNTSNGGFEFFENLNSLDKDASELRLLYLYCLFLGFRGRYYKTEDKKNLEHIFKIQKSFIHDELLSTFPKFAFGEAYAKTRFGGRKKFKTSYEGLWITIALSIGVALVLFFASQTYLNSLLDRYNIF